MYLLPIRSFFYFFGMASIHWFFELPSTDPAYLDDTSGTCPYGLLDDIGHFDTGFCECGKLILPLVYAQCYEPGMETMPLPVARWSSSPPSVDGQSSQAVVIANMLAFYEWIQNYAILLRRVMAWLAQTISDEYEDDPFDPPGTEWIPIRHKCLIDIQHDITAAILLLSLHGKLTPVQGDIALSICKRIEKPCTCSH